MTERAIGPLRLKLRRENDRSHGVSDRGAGADA